MDNIDAEALAEANRQGSTIMYYAGAAQRFPNIQAAANTRRPVAEAVAARLNVRQPAPQAPQNEEIPVDEAPAPQAPPRAPARRVARNHNQGDTVRVGRL